MTEPQSTIERFSFNDRLQHIVLIVSFTLLALTGIPQKYSSLSWAHSMIDLLGGIEFARIIHRVSAAILLGASVYHLGYGVQLLIIKRRPFHMLPRLKDITDLLHNLGYFLGGKKARPRFDRFNYMEKFEYWALVWGTAIMAISGLVLWFPVIVTRFLPGQVIPGAKALHSNEALLAVSAIVLWHLYNAHLNPRIFPMNFSIFTGRVSRHEMMTDHPLEYERLTGERVPETMLGHQPAKSWPVILVSGVLGGGLVILYVMMVAWTIQPPSPVFLPPINSPVARRVVLNPYATPTPPLIAVDAAATPAESCNRSGQSKTLLANFTAEAVAGVGPLEGVPPQTFQFTDLSAGQINCWEWRFGDGQTSTEQYPQHTYLNCPGEKGLCTVTLTVCGPDGCAAEAKFNYVCVSEQAICRKGC